MDQARQVVCVLVSFLQRFLAAFRLSFLFFFLPSLSLPLPLGKRTKSTEDERQERGKYTSFVVSSQNHQDRLHHGMLVDVAVQIDQVGKVHDQDPCAPLGALTSLGCDRLLGIPGQK